MGEIFPLSYADVFDVSSLFMKVFRKSTARPPASLQRYISALYLEHPWKDCGHVSLLYRDSQGRLIGFIGALPRPMLFGDSIITAVVAGNHMVDPEISDPFVATVLLKRLFSGSQELTFSDSANTVSQRLWEAARARTLHLYSLRWIRILRPTCFGIGMLRHTKRCSSLRPFLYPFGMMIDSVVGRTVVNRDISSSYDRLGEDSLRDDQILELMGRWSTSRILRPNYDARGIRWLLSMAAEKAQYGDFSRVAVMEGSEVVGWYMFYAKPGQVAEVLQVVARPGYFARVLRHLFGRALRAGCVAVEGLADPTTLNELSSNKCLLFQRNHFTVAYSRTPAILDSMHRGDALLTRLEAEWWTRLQGDNFE